MKITELLRSVGVDKITTASTSSGEMVRSACPLARWNHSTGKDNHPSFAVFVTEKDKGKSICKCLSCGFKGSLEYLFGKIEMLGQQDMTDQIRLIRAYDSDDPNKVKDKLEKLEANVGFFSMIPSSSQLSDAVFAGGRDFSDPLSVADAVPALPDGDLVIMNQMVAHLEEESLTYLTKKRGLSHEAIVKWKLGWHPGCRRISIPQFDRIGRLINIGGRHLPSILDADDWEPPPWMHAKNFKKELYLFGEEFVEYNARGKGTGVIVEGMFDAIWLSDRGVPNVMAMLGAHLGRYQVEKLVRWFDNVLVVPDGDKPGMEAADRILGNLGERITVRVFPTPNGLDPDELSDSDVREIKSLVSS